MKILGNLGRLFYPMLMVLSGNVLLLIFIPYPPEQQWFRDISLIGFIVLSFTSAIFGRLDEQTCERLRAKITLLKKDSHSAILTSDRRRQLWQCPDCKSLIVHSDAQLDLKQREQPSCFCPLGTICFSQRPMVPVDGTQIHLF